MHDLLTPLPDHQLKATQHDDAAERHSSSLRQPPNNRQTNGDDISFRGGMEGEIEELTEDRRCRLA